MGRPGGIANAAARPDRASQRVTGRRTDLFAAPDIAREDRADGSVRLGSRTPLGRYPATLCHHLERQAAAHPDRVFLAEPDGAGGWRRLSFAAMRRRARGLAEALIGRGLAVGDPVLILSENAVAHAVVQFAAMYAGLPACPVSPAYALGAGGFERLRAVAGRLRENPPWFDESEIVESFVETRVARGVSRESAREAVARW